MKRLIYAFVVAAVLAIPAMAQTATQLAVAVEPAGATAGVPFATQPVVEARDASNVLDTTFAGQVTATISTGTGTAGAVLSGTATVNAVAGVATFTDLSIDLTGTGYTLTFSSGSLTDAVSAPFSVDVAPGPATSLTVTTQPDNASPGMPFGIQPVVEAHDSSSMLDTTFTGPVTASISTGTGTAGAILSGTTTVNAVGGVATFTDLSIDLAGTGYTLTFASGTLTDAVSAPFDVGVGGPATLLMVMTQPGNASAGVPFGIQPVVEAHDSSHLLDPTFTGPVTASISTGTGAAGAILSGTLTVNAVGGVATFTDLSIDLAGTGYTLTFTSSTLTPAVSDPFDVNGAPPTFTCHHDLGRGLGFWANKPGKAILSGNDTAWRDDLNALNLVGADGSAYDVPAGDFDSGHADFRSWILGANARNMAYMLSAQMTALVLNLEFGPMSVLTDPHVEVDNVHVPLVDLLADANDLLNLHPVAMPPSQERGDQEELKDLFDAINNGAVPVCEPNGQPPTQPLATNSSRLGNDGDDGDETAGCTLAGPALPVLPLLAAAVFWRRRRK